MKNGTTVGRRFRVASVMAVTLIGLSLSVGPAASQSLGRSTVAGGKSLPEPILAVSPSARTITVGTVTYRVDADSRLFGLDGNRIRLGQIRLLPPRQRMFGVHAKVQADRSEPSGMPVVRELRMVPALAR